MVGVVYIFGIDESILWSSILFFLLFTFSLHAGSSLIMISLSGDKQADVIDAFNTTSRYLDDILNTNNVYFDNMVSQIYP